MTIEIQHIKNNFVQKTKFAKEFNIHFASKDISFSENDSKDYTILIRDNSIEILVYNEVKLVKKIFCLMNNISYFETTV